jgi:hypothetical protein
MPFFQGQVYSVIIFAVALYFLRKQPEPRLSSSIEDCLH